MKKLLIGFAVVASAVVVQAQTKINISGSDTLGGVMTDAIIAAGLNQKVAYVGGGSSVGEKAIVNGEIGVTAMSRELKPEAIEGARAKGSELIPHVIGLDGLAILVNQSNPVHSLDFATIVKIFTCEVTSWNQIPGSNKSGLIKAYRRDDKSGTTDTIKNVVGIKNFGACVTVVNETADIADHTATDADAIGYAGLSGLKAGNRAVSVSRLANDAAVQPNTSTIRSNAYPLARKLFVVESAGARTPDSVEQELLDYVLDRSFLDPILQDHDFVTLD